MIYTERNETDIQNKANNLQASTAGIIDKYNKKFQGNVLKKIK